MVFVISLNRQSCIAKTIPYSQGNVEKPATGGIFFYKLLLINVIFIIPQKNEVKEGILESVGGQSVGRPYADFLSGI
jgi:hypothetical protein